MLKIKKRKRSEQDTKILQELVDSYWPEDKPPKDKANDQK